MLKPLSNEEKLILELCKKHNSSLKISHEFCRETGRNWNDTLLVMIRRKLQKLKRYGLVICYARRRWHKLRKAIIIKKKKDLVVKL